MGPFSGHYKKWTADNTTGDCTIEARVNIIMFVLHHSTTHKLFSLLPQRRLNRLSYLYGFELIEHVFCVVLFTLLLKKTIKYMHIHIIHTLQDIQTAVTSFLLLLTSFFNCRLFVVHNNNDFRRSTCDIGH